MTNKKRCTTCGNQKPLTEFHKYVGDNCRSRDGYRAECKLCRNAKQKAYQLRVKQ